MIQKIPMTFEEIGKAIFSGAEDKRKPEDFSSRSCWKGIF